MGELNTSNTTTTNLASAVQDFLVSAKSSDGLNASGSTFYYNDKFAEYNGYYKTMPEVKKPIDALATYCTGKGYTTDSASKVILEHIKGSGEDTFGSLMWNMIVTKKINGDAYAEIIREDNSDPTSTLLNIKPLDPASVVVEYNEQGMVKAYHIMSKSGGKPTTLKPTRVLHLMNDRVYDEVHGTSVIEACKWIIDARNEAMRDWRRISHRSTIRVMYVDIENTTKVAQIKTQYQEAIKNGELMIVPGKPGDADIRDITLPPIDAFMQWIRYLENVFYSALGVPKVILGGSEEFTEASSKIATVTWEQYWRKEQKDLEDDLWNQIYIKVEWVKPVSLMNELLSTEDKNQSQTGFQPNDVMAGVGQ